MSTKKEETTTTTTPPPPFGVDCVICLQRVCIPVRITGFACGKRERGCNSCVRICYECAMRYLQLDRSVEERKSSIKCLTCSATLDPKTVFKPKTVMEKDYLYMSMDPCSNYRCIASASGCVYQGSQNEIDRHFTTSCPYRFIECRCGELVSGVENVRRHRSKCLFYIRCPVKECKDTFVDKYEVETHLLREHGQMICAHTECRKVVNAEQFEQHIKQDCIYRLVRCPCEDCNLSVRFFDLHHHVRNHLDTARDYLEYAKNKLKKYEEVYNRIKE